MNRIVANRAPHSRARQLRSRDLLALACVAAIIVVTVVVFASRNASAAKKAFPNGGRRNTDTPTTIFRSGSSDRPSSTRLAPSSPTSPKRSGQSSNQSGSQSSTRADPRLRRIGFRNQNKFDQHFTKHGREFGNITQEQYLTMAQDLRDAPLSKRVIETTQKDGTISRFDRETGGFLAFDSDLTIRTFFRPNDGENYFWRASKRSH
jgi:hypothetical protein